jgi:hypothetical protein
MNAFQVLEVKSATAANGWLRIGRPICSVTALPHLVIAVSPVVITFAARLILPWHRAGPIAEPVANIAVCAMVAWDGSLAAAILQRIVPARLIARRHHPVRVALAVALIEIVAVAAWRRAAVTPVTDFLGWGDAYVVRVGRYAQL